MKFGRVAVTEGEGLILAHTIKAPGFTFKKGDVLHELHILALQRAGINTVIGARLEENDVEENLAARRLARGVAGGGVRLDRAFTGRCNLLADAAGLVCVDAHAIDLINAVDEAITVATLPPFQPVVVGEMIATVKIIPFAVRAQCLERSMSANAPGGSVWIAPYRPLRVAVISTMLPSLKGSSITKTVRTLEARLAPAQATIIRDVRVAHEAQPLAGAIADAQDADLIVVFGASAITDRRDVVPVAIEAAHGFVEHLGMPVDPGNLLLLGQIAFRDRTIPIIGAPGCARSPKENGFDFVLRRLLAGLPVTGADIRLMGVGGLLSEIVSRPQLRQDTDG